MASGNSLPLPLDLIFKFPVSYWVCKDILAQFLLFQMFTLTLKSQLQFQNSKPTKLAIVIGFRQVGMELKKLSFCDIFLITRFKVITQFPELNLNK